MTSSLLSTPDPQPQTSSGWSITEGLRLRPARYHCPLSYEADILWRVANKQGRLSILDCSLIGSLVLSTLCILSRTVIIGSVTYHPIRSELTGALTWQRVLMVLFSDPSTCLALQGAIFMGCDMLHTSRWCGRKTFNASLKVLAKIF